MGSRPCGVVADEQGGVSVSEYMAGYVTGTAVALIVAVVVFRRELGQFMREEWRYRRDGFYVWRATRRNGKSHAER